MVASPTSPSSETSRGLECDVLYETGRGIHAIEVKSGATISSDYFASLNRVAELVPNIGAKTVVYGGTARQNRSDCDVIPASELAGVLQRFEVNQEIATFVDERRGSEPEDTDIETLDTVYRTNIRPILDGLESTFKPLGEELFRTSYRSFSIASGEYPGVDVGGFLEPSHWERTKKQYILTRGFKLSTDRPLLLKHNCRFSGYTGIGSQDFSLTLSIEWQLDDEGVSRSVIVDGTPTSQLEDRISYAELGTQPANVDHTIAQIVELMIAQIAVLSST